jgi:DNA-binding CsgD family transcriptional regulator
MTGERQRAQFIEATSELSTTEASVLAYSEQGYSASGIAKNVGCAEGTAKAILERIAARYGQPAIWPKQPHERGESRLQEVTREQYLNSPDHRREWWVDVVRHHPNEAPDWAVEEFGTAGDDEDQDDDEGDENGGVTLEGWE